MGEAKKTKLDYDILIVHDSLVNQQNQAILSKLSKAIPTLCFMKGTERTETAIKEAMSVGIHEVFIYPCSIMKLGLIWQHTVRRLMIDQGLTPGPIHGKNGEDFMLGAKSYQAKKCTSPIVKNIKREKRRRNRTRAGSTNRQPCDDCDNSCDQCLPHTSSLDNGEKKPARRNRKSWKTHKGERETHFVGVSSPTSAPLESVGCDPVETLQQDQVYSFGKTCEVSRCKGVSMDKETYTDPMDKKLDCFLDLMKHELEPKTLFDVLPLPSWEMVSQLD